MNKQYIINLLATNDKAVARALVALTARQTQDEKFSETTKHKNGRGFRPCHARLGTSMAEFFTRNGYRLQQRQAKRSVACPAGCACYVFT